MPCPAILKQELAFFRSDIKDIDVPIQLVIICCIEKKTCGGIEGGRRYLVDAWSRERLNLAVIVRFQVETLDITQKVRPVFSPINCVAISIQMRLRHRSVGESG